MRKRMISSLAGIAAAILMLVGCGTENTDAADDKILEETIVSESISTEANSIDTQKKVSIPETAKKVGVLMLNRVSERWVNDGTNIQTKLKALGYEVTLRYADDDIDLQNAQIEDMIAKGVDCLVIASIDGGSVKEIDSLIKEAGIPIIAYDRLLMDMDSVFFYASFDNIEVGRIIGNYIVEEKELEKARQEKTSYTIELFMGSPDDNNAELFL